jgi:hypothetical protein
MSIKNKDENGFDSESMTAGGVDSYIHENMSETTSIRERTRRKAYM